MNAHSLILLAGLLSTAAPAAAREEEKGEVPVGAARVDITPEGPIRLHGYLVRTEESRQVEQRIHAKALAIGADADGPVVLITVDLLGVPRALRDEVADRLHRRAGLDPDRLAVAASHTHSAPLVTGLAPHIFGKPIPADQQRRIDQYTRVLVDRLEEVGLKALAQRRPARLSWSRGRVDFAVNRRTAGGPTDHELPVLKATGPDGALIAVVVNYACHCTTIDPGENRVSGDWAGAAQQAIEADHPGCVALTVIGCGADANPARQNQPGAAAAHGRAVADEVNRLLQGPWAALPSRPPATAVEPIALPFDTPPTREQLEQLVSAGGPPGYNASVFLARLDRGEALPAEIPYAVRAWRFGDALAMVFLPGEVVVDYALRLKRELDPGRLWITAYANDVPCYIPSERILREGGYEGGGAMVYYGWPTRLRPGVEGLIVAAVHRAVGTPFRSTEKAAVVRDDMPPPLSPEEGLRSFRVRPGLKLELVAAEPLIESPVAIDFAADGSLWVCEMRDYPLGIDNQGKPGGVIKRLEDRDGDGRYDAAVTFLEGVPFPTGVMAWRKGVLICAAPDILYAEDTDGDGRADQRQTLFAGFATENFQARVNGLAYGLDNWVYGANGLIGGTIRGTANGREVDLGGRDFRLRPDTGAFEPAAGLTQQGRTRDDWGNPFGGNNSVLIQHYPLPDHYARRNPHIASPASAVALARGDDPARLFPASRTLARYNEPESANRVTSACSPLIYRDSRLGPDLAGNSFTCEPVHNLIRRLVLEPDGATFAGHRAPEEQTSEFLASTDSWCRPVQVRTGPDGALWIVDMYRFVIEHPRWISPDLLATLDVRAGAKMGRIYRLVPAEGPPRTVPRLDGLAAPELAAALDAPSGTLRDTIQRLLVHRADPAAVPVLAGLVRDCPRPEVRVQALGSLDGQGALDAATLQVALADAHPGVRRQAIRLAEPLLATDPAIGRAVLALADDPVLTVRYQTALSLGEWPDPAAGEALGRIAARDAADRWVRAAVLSSAVPHAGTVLEAVLAAPGPNGPSPALVEPLIATITATGNAESLARAVAALGGDRDAKPEVWRFGALARLLDGDRDGRLAADPAVAPAIAQARPLAADRDAKPDLRIAALGLLGRDPHQRDADRAALADRLEASEPAELQRAALRALDRMGDRPAAEAVLARWSGLGPAMRSTALDHLLARDDSTEALLAFLEDGRIAPAEIPAAQREALLSRGPDPRRQRAARILGPLAIGPRQAVLDAYAEVRTTPGDPGRGKAVFQRVCAACHQFAGMGHEVGPDLAALTDTSPAALSVAILDPNREVDARYAVYNAALTDGRVLSGLVAAETGGAITLKRQEGELDEVPRAELEALTTSGRSLMPEGLENDIRPAELADVIAFVAGGAARPKELAGNHPEVVAAGPDGSIRLTAATAEVYGPSLTFETPFENLGYWHQPEDRAAWTFRVDRPTTFTVSLEWACDDGSAGNRYALRVNDAIVHATVAGTGGWSNYRSIFVRELALPAGVHRLDMRPLGPIRGALADVRAIILTPRDNR